MFSRGTAAAASAPSAAAAAAPQLTRTDSIRYQVGPAAASAAAAAPPPQLTRTDSISRLDQLLAIGVAIVPGLILKDY